MAWPLILAGAALGVAATPHCAVMCGAPCAAITQGGRGGASGFHAGRLIGYAVAGALAARSVALLGAWSDAAPALRPLWTLLHLAFLMLGLWWLASGRQPAWLSRGGALPAGPSVPVRIVARRQPVARAALAGLAWVAWPCAALQGALLLSALGSDAAEGALVMAAYALASLPGLALAPWAWSRWQAVKGGRVSTAEVTALGLRMAGTALALASAWALTQGIWTRFAAWCAA